MDSSSCVGLVLARKGSKGIPKKNLALLNGHPLIHWVLEEMIQSHGKVYWSMHLDLKSHLDLN